MNILGAELFCRISKNSKSNEHAKVFLSQEEGSNKQLSYMYNSSHQANNIPYYLLFLYTF